MKKKVCSILFFLFLAINSAWSAEIKISDSRGNNFYLDALNWVLDKSGKSYEIIYTDYPVSSQKRKMLQVKQGELDLLYAGTSVQLEDELLPIRFPIMRGLTGRRIFIINKHYQSNFNSVNTLNDLRKFVGIQGIGWADAQVLDASGLEQTEKLYDDIFININAGSRYYFPRGMTEVFSELLDKQSNMPNLAIEQNILLIYKTAVFFFVNPDNKTLAETIEDGFRKSYDDGSYEVFFYNHPLIKSSLANANSENRTMIEINNPFLSDETKAIPERYWHQDEFQD